MRFAFLAWLAVMATVSGAQDLSGTLSIAGSDTLSGAISRAAASFRAAHPHVRIQLQTLGTASAVAALLDGAVDIGSMSRNLDEGEIAAFAARRRPQPQQLAIARDALVVFVHPANPLAQLSLQQIDAIFAATPSCGGTPVTHWNELVSTDAGWPDRPILAIGRNAASGTHAFFRDAALCGDRFRDDVIEWPGNGAVTLAVARNREAIGYASAGSVDAQVRVLALVDAEGKALPLDAASLRDGRYPLGRTLYLAANRDARQRLRPLTAAFMNHVLSDAGQASLRREGFQSLSADERALAASALQ